jgi:quinol monooxygenase YgiN
MATVFIYSRVADYDAWRRVFDKAVEGVRHRVWRGQDDSNLVLVWETWDSREAAEAAFADPRTAEVMAAAGVDTSSLRIEYFDEVT